jgi:hypothetical protein
MKGERLLLAVVLGVVLGAWAINANETLVVQEWVSVSQVLAGHVDVEMTDIPAKDVTVDLCSPHWETVLASTQTDDKGYFSLEAPEKADMYYLRLHAYGMNPYQLRVRLREDAPRELRIRMGES